MERMEDLYTKAIEWTDEGIRLWTDEEAVKNFVNADEAPEKVAMFRFVKKCMETAYPILQAEERILMGEAKRQPVGIADQLTREGADPLTRAEAILLAQMQQLQATTAEILSGEGCTFELVNTADKARQLTKAICTLSMELRLLQHRKRETTIDDGIRSYLPPQKFREIAETHKKMLKERGVQRT